MARSPIHHPPRWGLFGLSVVALGIGYAYMPWTNPVLPRGIMLLTTFIPLWIFATAWCAAGLLVAVAAIRRRPGWEGVGGVAFMCSLWGSFVILGWAVDQFAYGITSRSWFVGLILIGLSLYISGNVPPDPPKELGGPTPTVDKADR